MFENIFEVIAEAMKPNNLAKVAQIKAAIACLEDARKIFDHIDFNIDSDFVTLTNKLYNKMISLELDQAIENYDNLTDLGVD